MSTTTGIIDAALTALNGALGTGATGPTPEAGAPIDPLRTLAALELLLRRTVDSVDRSIGDSPVRAAAFARLSERFAHAGSHAQIVAAGSCERTEVNTLTDGALAGLNAVMAAPEVFARGEAQLPVDAVSAADRKPLHKGTPEFLESQFNLDYFQAEHRVKSHERLLPHLDADGRLAPARYPQLGRILVSGAADPRTIASAAAKLAALEPSIEAQPDPVDVRTKLEGLVAGTLVTAGQKTVEKLIKKASVDLDRSVLDRDEANMESNLGLDFKGKLPTGYVWELTTDAVGHELLMSLADDLNNPRTTSGQLPFPGVLGDGEDPGDGNTKEHAPDTAEADGTVCPADDADCTGSPADVADASTDDETATTGVPFAGSGIPGTLGTPFDDDFPPIPEWAANPDTPVDQRPRAGFNDVGRPLATTPEEAPRPGETAKETNARLRARRLHQLVFDAVTRLVDPQTPADVWMPMCSRIDILVTITYEALAGITDEPGFTQHGELISAATARRLACNAGILPLVMGGKSQPLDLGRKVRYFTKAQKRAIAARDRGCANPGCSMPVHRTEVHHIKSFSEGGKTNVSNGLLLCIRCHTAYHAGHFDIVVIDRIPHVVLPASRDPLRLPRRNWVFHPESAAA
ncbi:HNH endonuclease signature motif containing protein [Arthrobacter sp. AQ5-05]|uniref:HNH endonuclease signature motif containing protein n=1 Tax=Arthrobacter sp. AQ5-05 TaxID=2184581 RepID=UPI002570E5A2|nr:HNH endonuclease signature motif containing protein [Arthrobacter sp. AQ5-05]